MKRHLSFSIRQAIMGVAWALLGTGGALGQTAVAPLGTTPPTSAVPSLAFAFEFRVTLAPAIKVGQTDFGQRQYIPITGGAIAGPKLTGKVMAGGWDYQLGLPDHCSLLSADYFIRAEDGALIHVLNEGSACAPGSPGSHNFFRPRFEAPQGPHEWMTHATFIATLELEPPVGPAGASPPPLRAIRLKFYQVE